MACIIEHRDRGKVPLVEDNVAVITGACGQVIFHLYSINGIGGKMSDMLGICDIFGIGAIVGSA